MEMRTFDYTYILNNLRYHICNRGFAGVSTQAFINVSKSNHDVLPRTIVEDRIQQYHKDSFQKMWKKFSWKIEICPKQNSDRKLEIGSELVKNEE